jgi:hypothetical protein
MPDDLHIRADLEQRLVDAAQVAGTVIEKRNHALTIIESRKRENVIWSLNK